MPGWSYSFVAALEPGRTSWTQILDAARLGPDDDEAQVTAAQVRDVVHRLIAAGQWRDGDPNILFVFDAGYDLARLAHLSAHLPVEIVGRIRADRVLRLPAPPRPVAAVGRPLRHGGEFHLADTTTWPDPGVITTTETTRYDAAVAFSWDRLHPRTDTEPPGWTIPANFRSWKAPSSASPSTISPATAPRSRCGSGHPAPAQHRRMWTDCGRHTYADSTWNTPSVCSSRPWAGPDPGCVTGRRRPLDLAHHRRPHPTTARPPPHRRPPTPMGTTRPTRPTHPRPRPPRISEHPPEDRSSSAGTETHHPWPRTPARLHQQHPRYPPRRGQENQARQKPPRETTPQRLKIKLGPVRAMGAGRAGLTCSEGLVEAGRVLGDIGSGVLRRLQRHPPLVSLWKSGGASAAA